MTDIVTKLRTQGVKHPQQIGDWRNEAADEIERLRAELADEKLCNQELREFDAARLEQMAEDRKQALKWRDELLKQQEISSKLVDEKHDWFVTAHELERDLAKAEALCQQYREALEEAIEDIASWGAYASDYFQDKWDLSGNLKKYDALLTINNPIAALNNAIADELEAIAEGYMTYDPIDETRMMQYYGSHIRGVLRNRAKELRDA